MNDRRTAGRSSVKPNPVESSVIERAVQSANTPRHAIASAWLGIDASRRMPTPALAPIRRVGSPPPI